MAMTHDYLDLLNQRVDIAPANSQEELQAAETIAELMSQHDVEPSIEEFDTPVLSGLGGAVLSVIVFVGVLVSGLGALALSIAGFVLAALPAILALLRVFGREPSPSFGPQARSQNVVSVHRATGPAVTKGSRRIVIVAHYDTGRENFLYSTPIAPYLPLLSTLSGPCSYAAAVCALTQVFSFVPSGARIALWLVGILASVPGLVLAAGAIHERFSSCTLGANDNKAGVAALLGVLENVRPSGLRPSSRESEQSAGLDEVAGVGEVPEDEASPSAAEPVTAPTAEPTDVPAPVTAAMAAGSAVVSEPLAPEPPHPADYAAVEMGATTPAPEVPATAVLEAPTAEIPAPAPAAETPSFEPTAPVAADQLPAVEEAPEPQSAPVEVVGVRHGEGILRELQILPETCEIEYYDPEPRPAAPAPEPEFSAPAVPAASLPIEPAQVGPSRFGARAAGGPDGFGGEAQLDGAKGLLLRLLEGIQRLVRTLVGRVRMLLASPSAEEDERPIEWDEARAVAPLGDLDGLDGLDASAPAASEPEAASEEGLSATATAPVLRVLTNEDEPVATAAPEPQPGEDGPGQQDERPQAPSSDAAPEESEEDGLLRLVYASVSADSAADAPASGARIPTAEDGASLDGDSTAPVSRAAATPEDTAWGTSTFRPSASDFARRAALFDLPDPQENAFDPLESSAPLSLHTAPSHEPVPDAPATVLDVVRDAPAAAFAVPEADDEPPAAAQAPSSQEPEAISVISSGPQPIETLSSDHRRGRKTSGGGLMSKLKGALSGKGAVSDEPAADDDFTDGAWRGGAAARSGLRLVDGEEAAPTEEELREAVLRLGDDDLVAHDIWFVALGGSSLDHAGMRSFLTRHRSEIRGAFVINLDCVGAGDLTLLTHEGPEVKRRGDRRLGRILTNVARDLHVDLVQKDYGWTTTDAYPAMRSSLRALTIMGVDDAGLPALAHTQADVPENVSAGQVALVAELVTEAIRRS